jgi:hypothetical protein
MMLITILRTSNVKIVTYFYIKLITQHFRALKHMINFKVNTATWTDIVGNEETWL